jgi:hypothetical protein
MKIYSGRYTAWSSAARNSTIVADRPLAQNAIRCDSFVSGIAAPVPLTASLRMDSDHNHIQIPLFKAVDIE